MICNVAMSHWNGASRQKLADASCTARPGRITNATGAAPGLPVTRKFNPATALGPTIGTGNPADAVLNSAHEGLPMSSPAVRNFMMQQGFREEAGAACDMHFSSLYFQPRIVGPFVLLAILIGSPVLSRALGGALVERSFPQVESV